jgi:cytochrome c biogenesis protein CcmG, thiol:disulfide interchange protein DsbE
MRRDCEQLRGDLVDAVEATPSDARFGHVRRHLAQCETCRADFDALQAGSAALPHDVGNHLPHDDVRQRVLMYAADPTRETSRLNDLQTSTVGKWVVASAAVVMILSVSAVAAMRTGEHTPVVTLEAPAGSVMAPTAAAGVQLGSAAPSFAAADVMSGERFALADRRGEVMLVNIWATWCGPCESEMPSMQRLQQKLGDRGFSVVAVSVDQESTHKVRRWIEDRGITFTVLHDREGSIEATFQTLGVPESFVIDRNGVVVDRVTGPIAWDSPEAEARIVAVLDRK